MGPPSSRRVIGANDLDGADRNDAGGSGARRPSLRDPVVLLARKNKQVCRSFESS